MQNRTTDSTTAPEAGTAPSAGVTRKLETRVRALERENTRLKRVVASQALTIEALREISRGTY
jgi:hypothetical protein